MKDAFAIVVFLIFFGLFIFYGPNYMGDAVNYVPANPLVTPAHIKPEWYYLPFYAILRAVPDKLFGVIAMFSSILILLVLPWLDTSRVRSGTYRPIFKGFFWVFVIVCVALGFIGSKPPEGSYVLWGRILAFYYFFHFLVILPLLGLLESPKPLPASISEDVLVKKKPALMPAE
jgi:ubiquinol-cytochrome c reductase cytochrome b/c1 subunit